MIDGWEVLAPWDRLGRKASRMMRAMADAAPARTLVSPRYQGRRRCLMVYGPGSPENMALIRQHRRQGGRVAMWDMGYWSRADSMRLSIDALHPTPGLLALAPDGPGRRPFVLRDDADPAGPILLIGCGPKSVFAYGLGRPQQWERGRVKDLVTRFPGHEIAWRPKGRYAVPLMDLPMRFDMPIEDALRGCSRVVCRHSNVAVDACIAGIPVECEDGAAAALYRGNPSPSADERAEFLRRLTWWEWSNQDGPAAWRWIDRVINAAPGGAK